MNPKSFLGMMSDISDEYIVSAANPHSKPIRWYQISAVAACIILLISAAIYPKLRMQTPEITEPPAATVTAETTAQTSAETTAMTVYATYTTAVRQDATHQTTAETVSQIVTVTVTAAEPVIQNETKPGTESALQTDTKPNTEITDSPVTAQPIATTTLPDEATNEQSEPITEQSMLIPVLRAEPVLTEANQEAQKVTCKFHEATEEDLRTWGDEAIRFDRSAYKLICATISGYCQDAVIVRGTIMSDDCQLLIAYLNEHNVSDPIEVRYLMAFPIEMEIQVDNLHTNISQVLGERSFQALVEECSQSIVIQY